MIVKNRSKILFIFPYFINYFQEKIRKPEIRELISKIIFRSRYDAENDKVKKILEEGYLELGKLLKQDEVNIIVDKIKNLDCIDPWNKSKKTFKIDNVPQGVNVAHVINPCLIPEIYKILDKSLFDILYGYFGKKYYLDSIQAWWSIGSSAQPQEAEFFHRDNDSIKFIKLFVYLTKVDMDTGPHVFISGSHSEDLCLINQRYSDGEVPISKAKYITGDPGSAFLVNTFGLHKGLKPTSGNRLLLQFRFSIHRTVFESKIKILATDKNFDKHMKCSWIS